MNDQQIEAMKQLGNEWEKYGKHRIYFDDTESLIGLDVSYYNTGNVSGATLDGEKISNAECRRIQGRIGKIYYDFQSGKIEGDNRWSDKGLLQKAIENLIGKISEVVLA